MARFISRQWAETVEYTSDDTFIVPAGVYVVYISAVGGGGGGGSGSNVYSTTYHGSGGGGGQAGETILDFPVFVTPGESISITIGTGGAGGTAPSGGPAYGANGVDGNPTVFGSYVQAEGGGFGNAGVYNASSNVTAYGGYANYDLGAQADAEDGEMGSYAYGAGCGGKSQSDNPSSSGLSFSSLITTPGVGHPESNYGSYKLGAGGGGSNSFYGNGGDGGDFDSYTTNSGHDGDPGTGYGAGGGGGCGKYSNATGFAGGAGTDGFLIVKYYMR